MRETTSDRPTTHLLQPPLLLLKEDGGPEGDHEVGVGPERGGAAGGGQRGEVQEAVRHGRHAADHQSGGDFQLWERNCLVKASLGFFNNEKEKILRV